MGGLVTCDDIRWTNGAVLNLMASHMTSRIAYCKLLVVGMAWELGYIAKVESLESTCMILAGLTFKRVHMSR